MVNFVEQKILYCFFFVCLKFLLLCYEKLYPENVLFNLNSNASKGFYVCECVCVCVYMSIFFLLQHMIANLKIIVQLFGLLTSNKQINKKVKYKFTILNASAKSKINVVFFFLLSEAFNLSFRCCHGSGCICSFHYLHIPKHRRYCILLF